MMKKKLLSVILSLTMAATLLAGCGGNNSAEGTGSSEEAEVAEGEAEAEAVSTVGPDSGTHMEMWTFVELHSTFYAGMLEKWNAANPDRQIQITFTTYPYGDMHTKLTMALQTGDGAPDLCDVEMEKYV